MKLLFDFNLSPKLVGMLADLFESAHAYSVGLGFQSTDNAIWDFARDHGYTIVTADRDFLSLSEVFGAPPRVIRLERMNFSTRIAADVIRRYSVAIADFERSGRPTLILRND